jgi:outer membrane protein assembly factor BamB
MTKNLIFCTILLMFCVSSVPAADWTLYRGDAAATGRAAESGGNQFQLKIAWEQRLEKGDFRGTPITFGNTVFIGSSDEGMCAFDVETGKPKWKSNITEEMIAPAAFFDGLIFVGDVRGTLYALNADTGKEQWTFPAKGTIDNSPNIDSQTKRVLVGSQHGTLFALEAATGKLVWEYKTEDQIRCFPSMMERRCFVAGCDTYLHVVDLDTGKGIHRIPLEAPTGSTPLLAGDMVYVGTEGNEFLAIDWKKEKIVWRLSMRQAVRAPAAYRDGTVIVGGMDKTVYALDAKTGKERWTFNTKGRIEGGAVIDGNRVYVPSADSSLYVLGFQDGKRLGSVELPGKLSASPAFAANRIFIATEEGVLVCLCGE